MPTYEMLWDCAFCGTKKLLGKTHKHCPNCGGAQNPDWRYFPSDAEKVAVENHIYVGPDKSCPACAAPNVNAASHCTQCGASMDGTQEVARRATQRGDAFAGETEADAKRERAQQKAAAKAPTKKVRKFNWPAAIFVTVALGIPFCVGLDAVWTETHPAQVTALSWSREIDIEEFGPMQDSAWCDSMPSDARGVSRTSEVRSHEQVADGEDCSTVRSDNGDGTFSESESCTTRYRSEAVYDSYCHYTVDRWHFARKVVAKGFGRDGIGWPAVKLTRTGQCVGCEREGPRRAEYKALVRVDPEQPDAASNHDCTLDEPVWQTLQQGAAAFIEKSVMSGSVACSSLRSTASTEGH